MYDLLTRFKSMGNIAYESIMPPTQTTVIERTTGSVFKRFGSWQEYLEREPEFPYSQYIVIGGLRARNPKKNLI